MPLCRDTQPTEQRAAQVREQLRSKDLVSNKKAIRPINFQPHRVGDCEAQGLKSSWTSV